MSPVPELFRSECRSVFLLLGSRGLYVRRVVDADAGARERDMRRGLVRAAIAAVAVVAVLVTAWVVWLRPATVTAPRARQYLDESACLLTGPGGVAQGTAGGQVWQAMQSASLASHVMVSYLPVAGPADVPALLNSLVERRCGVIVVTGASRVQVASAAKANPGRHFILVATSTAAGPTVVPANAVVVPAAEAAGRIGQEVTALACAA